MKPWKLLTLILALTLLVGVLTVGTSAASPTPLTFTAEEAGSSVTFKYKSGTGVQYNLNGGGWTDCPSTTKVDLTNKGDSVQFKGTNVVTEYNNHFIMTGKIAASGDVTSLTNGEGGDAKLTYECYAGMFIDCTSLTAAPALPATKLAEKCYFAMFSGCTNLTAAPALPATELATECYHSMFSGCASLTAAPTLPAMKLAGGCYQCMFSDCASLTAAPALPAMELETCCYQDMFSGCTSLTAPVDLSHVTKLAGYCCYTMYKNCTNLKVYASEQPAYATEWKVNAEEVSDWAADMFKGTGGDFTSDPVVGTTYYTAATYSYTVLSPVAAGAGTLMLNGNAAGEYIIMAKDNGFILRTGEDYAEYLVLGEDRQLTVTRDAEKATVWKYDGGLYTEVCCGVRRGGFFRAPRCVRYYLAATSYGTACTRLLYTPAMVATELRSNRAPVTLDCTPGISFVGTFRKPGYNFTVNAPEGAKVSWKVGTIEKAGSTFTLLYKPMYVTIRVTEGSGKDAVTTLWQAKLVDGKYVTSLVK